VAIVTSRLIVTTTIKLKSGFRTVGPDKYETLFFHSPGDFLRRQKFTNSVAFSHPGFLRDFFAEAQGLLEAVEKSGFRILSGLAGKFSLWVTKWSAIATMRERQLFICVPLMAH